MHGTIDALQHVFQLITEPMLSKLLKPRPGHFRRDFHPLYSTGLSRLIYIL